MSPEEFNNWRKMILSSDPYDVELAIGIVVVVDIKVKDTLRYAFAKDILCRTGTSVFKVLKDQLLNLDITWNPTKPLYWENIISEYEKEYGKPD